MITKVDTEVVIHAMGYHKPTKVTFESVNDDPRNPSVKCFLVKDASFNTQTHGNIIVGNLYIANGTDSEFSAAVYEGKAVRIRSTVMECIMHFIDTYTKSKPTKQ